MLIVDQWGDLLISVNGYGLRVGGNRVIEFGLKEWCVDWDLIHVPLHDQYVNFAQLVLVQVCWELVACKE